MRIPLLLLISACFFTTSCRKRKPVEAPAPAPEPQAAAPVESARATSQAAAPATTPPVTADQLEAGPEFADLNNLVEYFYERNQRVPTLQELAKMNGGPLPNPPGYKLVIDPKSKTVKAAR